MKKPAIPFFVFLTKEERFKKKKSDPQKEEPSKALRIKLYD